MERAESEKRHICREGLYGSAAVLGFSLLNIMYATATDQRFENYHNDPSYRRSVELAGSASALDAAKTTLLYVPAHLSTLNSNYFPLEWDIPDLPPLNESHVPDPEAADAILDRVHSDLDDFPETSAELGELRSSIAIDLDHKYDDQIIELENLRQELILKGANQDEIAMNRSFFTLKDKLTTFSFISLGISCITFFGFLPLATTLHQRLDQHNDEDDHHDNDSEPNPEPPPTPATEIPEVFMRSFKD